MVVMVVVHVVVLVVGGEQGREVRERRLRPLLVVSPGEEWRGGSGGSCGEGIVVHGCGGRRRGEWLKCAILICETNLGVRGMLGET